MSDQPTPAPAQPLDDLAAPAPTMQEEAEAKGGIIAILIGAKAPPPPTPPQSSLLLPYIEQEN